MLKNDVFVATDIDLVDHHDLVPADYNPRQMDERTLRVLVRSLARFGWVLPVVANRRTGNIVGGHQRARANAHILKTAKGRKAQAYRKVPVIYVDLRESEEKALNIALNQISGDWDFFKRAAANELRQNATFAQMTRKHHELSRGYRAPLGVMRFDLRDSDNMQHFCAEYGTRILDFGCGRGQEVAWLSEFGITARGFEPFRRVRGSDRLDVKISRKQADQFLRSLASGFRPSTVFCNFVISSIGSPSDRAHVLSILQALGTRAEQVVIAVRSTNEARYQEVLGKTRNRKSGYLAIPDASERGLVVTGAGTTRQKFQKFFDPAEFKRLARRFFKSVEIAALEPNDPALVAVCRDPKPIKADRLERALRFEFNLRINDEPLDRADRAIAVFNRWLKRK